MADRRMFSRGIFQSSVMVRLGYDNSGFGLEAQRVFETLILMADDYGRGKFIPENIRGQAFLSVPDVFLKVTPEMIETWAKQIEVEGAVQIYNSGGTRYYALTGWSRYQRGDWQRGESGLPEPPLLETVEEQLETVETKGKGKGKGKGKSKSKVKKNSHPSDGKPSGRDATAYYTDEYRKRIDKTYKPTEIDAKQCKRALIHLGYDLDQYKECVKNCLDDPYFRDNKPGAAFFYRHIEKYKKPVTVDDFGPEVPEIV